MNLVIVESPTKAKTIGGFLKKDYEVISSYGHMRDLPKSKIGIDLEKDFEPHYIIPMKAKKRASELKKTALKKDVIILATDEDREGEAIAWHLLEILTPEIEKRKKKPIIERIAFHEITKEAIENALKNPRQIDINLVNAQQARRVLDRIVGYKLSPFLWEKVAKRLSAGRVQSIALKLIIEREREIKAFVPEEYWSILTKFDTEKNNELTSELEKIDNKKIEINDKDNSERIKKDLLDSSFLIKNISEKTVNKNPLPPFITSTLQQDAFKRLRFSSKQTMRLAQMLYEKGLITYMRTDSFNLSHESLDAAKQWIEKNFGHKYASEAPRPFKTKSKVAQEAHEAIRPTSPAKTPKAIDKTSDMSFENAQEEKLYELIWRRFMASQMPQAKFTATSIEIEGTGKEHLYLLKSNGNILEFDGFLKVWISQFTENQLPQITKDEKLTLKDVLPEQHFTQPPARYSEASIIKALEENGIGRPSTYAPTISVIQERNYVFKNEKRQLEPTEIGFKVNDILVEHFPQIVDMKFTAKMEEELDEVANGEKEWKSILREFYGPFAKLLEEKYKTVEKQKITEEKTDEVCEKCGKPMAVKYSRFGKFLACTGFPECRSTKSLQNNIDKDGKTLGKCPKCPTLEDPLLRDKPGNVVRKRTKKGRFFYGCSNYPKCDFASWKKPEETVQADNEQSLTTDN